jgi:maltoporin
MDFVGEGKAKVGVYDSRGWVSGFDMLSRPQLRTFSRRCFMSSTHGSV